MKYIFFGTEHWAAQFLEYLISHDLKPLAVVTQEDKKAGRGLNMEISPVKKVSLEHTIPIFQPKKCSSPEFIEHIKSLQPELCVLIAYGQILPKELLDIPQLGFVNLHPSLLPHYRGPSPFQAPILNGDMETGMSIMIMDEQMDHGPILIQEHIQLDSQETSESLHEKVIEKGCPLLVQAILSLQKGTLTSQEQDHTRATYTKLIKKEMGNIDCSKTAESIERMVRALQPWPGTWFEWRGKRIKILKAQLLNLSHASQKNPGEFFSEGENLYLQCADNFLGIELVQVEGKKPLSAKEFIHGYLKPFFQK